MNQCKIVSSKIHSSHTKHVQSTPPNNLIKDQGVPAWPRPWPTLSFLAKAITFAEVFCSGTAPAPVVYYSISIEESSLIIRLADLPVLSNKHVAHNPSQNRSKGGEGSARAHCGRVSRFVRVRPKIGRVNWRDRGNCVHKSHCDSLFLFRLPTSAGDPAENDAVAGVDAARKGAHGEIPSTGVSGCAGQNEAQYGECFGHGDVPVQCDQSMNMHKQWECSFAPGSLIHTA